MEQDTRVWVYILIWNVHFLHKNNAIVSLQALSKGLGGICHWRNEGGGAKGALPPPPLKLVKV